MTNTIVPRSLLKKSKLAKGDTAQNSVHRFSRSLQPAYDIRLMGQN